MESNLLETIYLVALNILWWGGFLLIMFSYAVAIIELETDYEKERSGGYGYSIKEIRKAIEITKDSAIKKRLALKIKLRKIGYWSILIGLVIIILKSILSA